MSIEEAYEKAYLRPSPENIQAAMLAVLEEAWQIPGRTCHCSRCEEQLVALHRRIEGATN